ncbi:MAG: hypothetical protein ACLUR5_11515 [Eubacterium ventriosum]
MLSLKNRQRIRCNLIDGKGEIGADDYRAIEQEAPGIVDRQSVSQPMEHGIWQ